MKQVKSHSHEFCSIVFDEYMRATGFFYSSGESTYLVTARHNCLPTVGNRLKTGQGQPEFQVENKYDTVDIYLLRESDGRFNFHRVNMNKQSIVETPEIDIVAISVDFAPDKYGYKVWQKANIVAPKDVDSHITTDDIGNRDWTSERDSERSLRITGYAHQSFPDGDREYNPDMYRNSLGYPVSVPLDVTMSNTSMTGLRPRGMNFKHIHEEKQYDGLSGSPVVENGLVGIHSTSAVRDGSRFEYTPDEIFWCSYTRADVLPKMVSQHHQSSQART